MEVVDDLRNESEGSFILLQGMTIRTARLPGAGNLLGRAGEDLSGLPGWANRYQFFYFFIDSIIFQFKH